MIPRCSLLVLFLVMFSGCAFHPAGEKEERDRIDAAGKPFVEHVELPPLPDDPTPDDYLQRAFLSNAELQARYWEWKAAIEQVPQDASPPKAAVSFGYLFSGGHLKSWDRTTLGLSNDPEFDIPFPTKLATAGRKALEEARAAGLRFEAAKFRLQAQVLSTYLDIALHAELLRAQEEMVALLRLSVGEASAKSEVGAASSVDFVNAQTELDLARNALENLHGQLPPLAAKLNALLGRESDATVPLPRSLPPPRPLPATDAEIVRLAAERSPDLAALARAVAGREAALSLAKQEYIPDFNLSASITGSVSQTLGAVLVLPTRVEAIRAGVEQARASLHAAEAMRTQYARDLAASFVLDLSVLRNAERQIALFEGTLVPRAEQSVKLAENAYATSRGTLADLVAAERARVDARFTLAELRAEREKALAAIETWSALDVETLHPIRMGMAGR